MSAIIALRVKAGEPVRRGNAHYWRVMRQLTEGDRAASFSAPEIHAHCDVGSEMGPIRDYLRLLEKAKFVELLEDERRLNRWRLLKRPAMAPRIDRNGLPIASRQDAMWNAIRALKSFTCREVSLAGSTEETPLGIKTVKAYVHELNAAGYLKIEVAATTRSLAVYRLKPSMDSGPLSPAILKAKMVYDQNRNEVIGAVLAEEDRP